MPDYQNILIVHLGTVGDIVFTTPVVRALRTTFTESTITYLCSKEGANVLESNPYVDDLIVAGKHSAGRIEQVKSLNPDLSIDLQNSTSSKKFMIVGKRITTGNRFLERWLLVNLKINRFPNKHIVDQYFHDLAELNLQKDTLGLDFFISPTDEMPAEWFEPPFQKSFIVLAISSPYQTRQLPLHRLIELCERINKPVILIGTEKEHGLGDELKAFFEETSAPNEAGLKKMNKKTRILNTAGQLNINQAASVIRRAEHVFTYDNDFLPLASAFKRNIFTIWGNTLPLFGRYPYKTRFTIYEKDVPCRPCSSTGFSKCPRKHFNCMEQITFDFYLT